LNAEVLLKDAAAKDGQLVLPGGMSYRYLVLPHQDSLKVSPTVLRKIAKLVEDGVTAIGPKPALEAPGLTDYPECDREVRRLAERLWGNQPGDAGERKEGTGRVIWGKTPASVIAADGLAPDVEFRASGQDSKFDWIHRRAGGTDIYFVSNQKAASASAEIAFRTSGRQPELWDAVTGEIRALPEFHETNGRTLVPMRFEPRQSFFLVFRKPASSPIKREGARNFPESLTVAEIAGPWEVAFDPKWGGPEKASFATLEEWTKRPEEGIRYYSGTAVYRKTFDIPSSASNNRQSRIYLDLGTVKNLASIKLNGQDLGVVWTAPWHVEITKAVQKKGNRLEIAVVNLWPNRLIGDAKLPPKKRFATTNVKTYLGVPPEFSLPGGCKACEERKRTNDLEKSLLPSGLLGPVTVKRQVKQ